MHLINHKIYYFIDEFNKKHLIGINKKINLIFRNYTDKFSLSFYKELKIFCHNCGFKIYLSNNFKIAHTVGFDGVYLPSFNKKILNVRNLKKNFELLGSAHNVKDIRIKEKQGINLIFLSPVFEKKSKKHLGIHSFINLTKYTNKKVVALGGINYRNIKILNLYGYKSYAAINWIKNNVPK